MAKIGRPILFRKRSIETLGQAVQLYRETMLSADFDERTVDQALGQSWVWYEAHLAETDDQAWDEFLPAFEAASKHVAGMRERWNPKDQIMPQYPTALPRAGYGPTPDGAANEAMVGAPRRVAEQVALLRDAGVRNLMLTNRGVMSPEQTFSSLRLLSEKVMPGFR